MLGIYFFNFFFLNDSAPTVIYTLSLHDALPISSDRPEPAGALALPQPYPGHVLRPRSEEHTSELQSRGHLVCRLLLEKKNKRPRQICRASWLEITVWRDIDSTAHVL